MATGAWIGIILLSLALLPLAAVLLTLLRVAWRHRRAERLFPPMGHHIAVNGHRLQYLTRGQGPDVVALSGVSTNMREITETLMPRLTDQFRVTVFDRPGQGYSDDIPTGDSPSIAQVDHYVQALEQLGIERPILLGQSYGGTLVLAWLTHRPDTLSAAVVSSAPAYGIPAPKKKFRIFHLLDHPVIGPVWTRLIAGWVSPARVKATYSSEFAPFPVPDDYMGRVGSPLALRVPALRSDGRNRRNIRPDCAKMSARYHEIRLPVEIVHGAEDGPVAPELHARPLQQEIPGARLKLVKGHGHMLHWTAPEAVVEAVQRAARRAAARGTGAHPTGGLTPLDSQRPG